MATITFGSLEDYKAAKDPKFRRSASAADPLDRFVVPGIWATGQIIEYDGRPLPALVHVDGDVECRASARKGWRPLKDRDGKIALEPEIVAMFVEFYRDSDDVPPLLVEALGLRVKAVAVEPPKPATAAK